MLAFKFTSFLHRFCAIALVFGGILLNAGCAGIAPAYRPSISNVELFKQGTSNAVAVGEFTINAGAPGSTSLAMRANSMSSPEGSHYGDYLAAAIKKDLAIANLLGSASGAVITGQLITNNIDVGVSKGAAQMEARFVVTKDKNIRFDKVKRADHAWDSEFAAMVAIPLAVNNYPIVVQKLIQALAIDPDFSAAVNK